MSKKKTHDVFLKEIFNLVKDEYDVLDNYVNAKTKIRFKHIKCKNIFYMTPDHFLRGQRCPDCFGNNIKKTIEQFKKEVYDLVGNEYIVLGEYVNGNTKIIIKHVVCQNEYSVTPSSFLIGSRCPKCQKLIGISKISFTYEDVILFIESIEGYKLLSDNYKNRKIKLNIQCPDGHLFKMNFDHFKRGERCPDCANVNRSKNQRKDINIIEDEVTQYSFKIIGWIGEYKNRNSRFVLECKNGHQNEVSVASFLNHHGCRSCNRSKGEELIEDFLQLNDIVYDPQYKFDDCKHIRKLPFDFAIFNDVLLLFLIEYDGDGHYKSWTKFGKKGDEILKKVQHRDSIKTNYCLNNNIPLLRIPYWDFDNIPQILTNELSKYNLLGGDYKREVAL